MIPSIHDFRGAPIPGLPAGGLQGGSRIVPFQRQFEQLLAPRGTAPRGSTSLPSAPSTPQRIHHLPFVAPPAVQEGRPRTVARRATTPTAGGANRHRPTSEAKRALASQIHTASADVQVDPHLAVAIARAESSLNPKAVSPDGISVGAFQVTWDTKAEMRRKFAAGAVERPAGTDDVAMGVAYLRYLNDLIGRGADLGRGRDLQPVRDLRERQRFTAAAYNAGEGAVARAQGKAEAEGLDPTRYENIRSHLPSITRAYVDRVTRFAAEERVDSTAS